MDRQIRRHLDRRGIRLAHGRPAKGLLGTDGGIAAFFRWFHEDVMMFDSMEYRRQFWREAYRHGHTIGDMPRTAIEFTDPRRHPYNTWLVNLAILVVAAGASAVVWYLVRTVDAHIRRLRRPTYYETERERRIALAEERRRIRRRTTTSPCPTPDMLRAAFSQARASTANMIRFGSMLEDLECYVDNSVVWNAEEGRIVGRRGGILQWFRENAEDLSERYKTVMKYKALAKRFRQAVGVSDPVPASAVLPPDTAEQGGNAGSAEAAAKNEKKGVGIMREYSSEQSRVEQESSHCGRGDSHNGTGVDAGGRASGTDQWKNSAAERSAGDGKRGQTPDEATPEAVARSLLAACEGTVASLTAQLALMVSEDFVPHENIARNKRMARARRSLGMGVGGNGVGVRRSSA